MYGSPRSSYYSRSSESWEHLSGSSQSDINAFLDTEVDSSAVALSASSQGSHCSAMTQSEGREIRSIQLMEQESDSRVLSTNTDTMHQTAESASMISLGQPATPGSKVAGAMAMRIHVLTLISILEMAISAAVGASSSHTLDWWTEPELTMSRLGLNA